MWWSKHCHEIRWGGRFILRNIIIRQKEGYWERKIIPVVFSHSPLSVLTDFWPYSWGPSPQRDTLAIMIRHIIHADTLNTSLPTFFLKVLSILLLTASHDSQVCGPGSKTLLTWVLLIQHSHPYSMVFCGRHGLKHKEQHSHFKRLQSHGVPFPLHPVLLTVDKSERKI